MKYQNRKRRFYLSMVLFLVLFIGIGYAYLSSSLTTKGSMRISKNTWDIHFENIVIKTGSVSATSAPTIQNNSTVIEFGAALNLPGDFFEFNVDVVNKGSIDAMVSEVVATGLTTSQQGFLEYTVSYIDAKEIKEKDSLRAGATETITVGVKYKDNLSAGQLPSQDQILDLLLKITYVQEDGSSNPRPQTFESMLASASVIDNKASQFVTNSGGIDFSDSPSDTNGKGVYLRAETEKTPHPIYYYRGNVNNNHVKFAGFCWKIVRTTDTGGIKLIYNGTPASDGSCNNTGTASQIGTSAFNSTNTTLSGIGYMYGASYPITSSEYSDYMSPFVYAETVTYSVNEYVFGIGTTSGNFNTVMYALTSATDYPYTCFTSGYGCNPVYYVTYMTPKNASYLQLSSRKDMDTTIKEMTMNSSNTTNSTIKTYLENWYRGNLTSYTAALDDTIWCNRRTVEFVRKYASYAASRSYSFGSDTSPHLDCDNVTDQFAVNRGNALLSYPIGLLTADEVKFAGMNTTNTYLYSGTTWWTMTPNAFSYSTAIMAAMSSYLKSSDSNVVNGVRPAIALKAGTKFVSGKGTSSMPYVVE